MADLFTIRCRENGPLVVPTNVKVVDHQGKEFPLPQGKDVIALCRCGHSANKPFCDGKHREVGFQGMGRIDPLDKLTAEDAEERRGK